MSSNECWAKSRTRLGVLSDESSEIRTSNICVCCSSIACRRFVMFCLSLYEGMPTVILHILAFGLCMSFEFCDSLLVLLRKHIFLEIAPSNEIPFAAAKHVQRRGKLQGNICLLGPMQKRPCISCICF